mmetsp:Transcript_20577/g.27113  ORF Transcript_20577/g.27113 Transcript_20577/m.27113 type:complete len:678 (+) Transcript_20577:889-2922(+)
MWGLIHQDTDPDTLHHAMGNTEMAADLNQVGERGEILNRVVRNSRNAWQMAKREQYQDLDDLTEEAKQSLLKSDKELECEYQGIMKVNTVRHPHPTPWQCLSLRGVRITSIAAGYGHAMALSSEGRLFAYGYNDKGQLGLGHRINSSNFLPIKHLDGRCVVQVTCGQHHTLARVLTPIHGDRAACYSWGSHALGQLGLGRRYTGQGRLVPNRLTSLDFGDVIDVAAGGNHSVAVMNDNSVYSWGHAEYGQHGNTYSEGHDYLIDSHHYYVPQRIQALQDCGIVQVECGSQYSLGISKDGKLWSWGWNAYGVLGKGQGANDISPEVITGFGKGVVVGCAAGYNHCAMIVESDSHTRLPLLKALINSPGFSDVQFLLEKDTAQVFYAHKPVLAARCPYLKGYIDAYSSSGESCLYSTPIDEDCSRQMAIVLPETWVSDAVVLKALLVYLYTDRLEIPRHKRVKLLMLANALQLEKLQQKCIQGLSYIELKLIRADSFIVKSGSPSEEETSFEENMEFLLSSGKCADVRVQFEEHSVLCHSLILCRLEFFKGLLLGGFREGDQLDAQGLKYINLSNLAEEGVGAEAFLIVLRFMYTGARKLVDDLDPNLLMEIIVLAGLLGITYLVKLCEIKLCRFVLDSDTNAMHCLDYATRYDLLKLARQCSQVLSDAAQGPEEEKSK